MHADFYLKKCVLLLVLTSLLACTGCSKSEPPPSVDKLIRVTKLHDGKAALEVLSARYHPKGGGSSGQYVDFIGAVHLGEDSYFNELNKRFKEYDVVLFELVGDPDKIHALKESSQPSMLGAVQKKMGEVLGLSFQLDGIDYDAPNFLHADMTSEQLMEAFAARGESPFQLLLKMLKLSFDPELQKEFRANGYSSKELEGINPLMVLLRGPTEAERAAIKKFMALGLMSSDKVLKVLEGDGGSVLIADRNKVAVQAVKHQLEKGTRRIAVYYGGGHLPDMDKRFREELGLALQSVWWTKAWDLKG